MSHSQPTSVDFSSSPVPRRLRWLLIALLMTSLTTTAQASVIYVDNLRGRDVCDGLVEDPIDRVSGPVRTLARAVALARPSDTIHLINTGHPYQGDLRLHGQRHSGIATLPFRVIGNGAVISGAKPVPAVSWRSVGGLWQLAPRRKGHYLLLRDGKPLPRHDHDRDAAEPVLESLPDGHWTVWRGKIYYRTSELIDSGIADLAIAGGDCGITLYAVRHVRIENLVVQHWRLDGISAPGRCRDVVLHNVTCRQNARAGLVISGTSQIRGEKIELNDNRGHSLLIEDFGLADIVNGKFSKPPTLAP